MNRALKMQLTFDPVVYPAATQALRAFATSRSRSDYLKNVLEAHFLLLQAGLQQPPPGPQHAAPPNGQQSDGTCGGLNEHDVVQTFSRFFPT